jgi:hypothetical protein
MQRSITISPALASSGLLRRRHVDIHPRKIRVHRIWVICWRLKSRSFFIANYFVSAKIALVSISRE